MTRGLSKREISVQLGISQERIKQHLNAIYEKIGALRAFPKLDLTLFDFIQR